MGLLTRALMSGRPSDENYKGASFTIAPNNGTVEFANFVVPRRLRGQGIGESVMQRLERELDAHGLVAQLSPEALDKGTDVRRLRSFYKRHGFVSNRGENKVEGIASTMYRVPK